MPPATPSRTFGRRSRSVTARSAALGAVVALGVLEQAGLDLAHGDRQRLLARARLDERADVLQQALAQLGVVVVDLAGPLGGVDHQRVLRADLAEQVVDRRVGDALGGGPGDGTGQRHAHEEDSWEVVRTAGACLAGPFPTAPGPTNNSTN